MIALEKKLQQHYVWEYYLASWCYNNRQLYCYRTKDENVFPVNPEKIAKEREFYKLKNITPSEAELIEQLFIKDHKTPKLRELNRKWIVNFTEIFRIKQFLESQNIATDEINNMIDVLITNLEEEHHTNLEKRAIPYLEALKKGYLNVKENDDAFVDFLIFLSTQYFRTKKIKMNFLRSAKELGDKMGVNVENMWNISSHIFATSLAFGIYEQRDNYKCYILICKGNIPFITGDQPVINTLANYSSDVETDELELYYPVSPDKALLISKENFVKNPTTIEISEDEVRRYNSLILAASEEQVFSNNKELLNELINNN